MLLVDRTAHEILIFAFDDPRNITRHTMIAAPDVYADPDHFVVSVADWSYRAANGSAADCGIDLAEKVYEKTE